MLSFWKNAYLCIFTYKTTINFIMMKPISLRGWLLTAFIFGLFFRMAAQSTQLVVFLNEGTEQTYMMHETDRLYFEDNTKLVIEEVSTKSTVTIPLADIRKITCNETEGIGEAARPSLWLSPNPSHNAFMLHNLNGKETIHIYALDGRLMKAAEVTGEQFIDISDLAAGLYLVKTQSCTLKMIKL